MKKKVLFFMHLPPPFHGVTICNRLIEDSSLIRNSINSRILPIRYGKTISDMQSNGIKKIWIMLLIFLKLFKELLIFRPNIVYFTIAPLGLAFYRDVLFVSLIKLFKVKIVYHIHGKGIARRRSKLDQYLYRYAFKNSTIICISKILSKDVEAVKDNANIEICSNGIEDGLNCYEQNLEKGKRESIDVVYLSNLSRMKGVDIFLDVVSMASKNKLPINFHLAGPFSNVYREKDLERFFELNKGSNLNLTYHGAVYDEEKWRLLAQTDILIHPTRNDAFPLVVLEGLAAGNVILAAGEGGIPDMLRGLKGSKVMDKENYYSELVSLLNNKDDLQKYQVEAREHFKHNFSKEIFENRILEILLNA